MTRAHVQVVLFCNGENCGELTAVLDEIGAYPTFEFVRIDCATDENREKCAGAGNIREVWRNIVSNYQACISCRT